LSSFGFDFVAGFGEKESKTGSVIGKKRSEEREEK